MTPEERIALLSAVLPPSIIVDGLSQQWTIDVVSKATEKPEFISLGLALPASKASRSRTPRMIVEMERVRVDLIDAWLADKADRARTVLDREARLRHARSGA